MEGKVEFLSQMRQKILGLWGLISAILGGILVFIPLNNWDPCRNCPNCRDGCEFNCSKWENRRTKHEKRV